MNKLAIAVAVVGVITSASVLAQGPAVGGATMTATAPGAGVAANAVEITASVQAIDKANRTITIKGPHGNVETVAVGPEVKNFEQIKVGDNIALRYMQALSLELKKGGKAPVARTESMAGAKAVPGDKPAAGVGRRIHVIADVVAADPATQTVTLRGPKQTVELKVRDPEQFNLIKVGDQVEATYTEALALSVEPAAMKK